MSDTTLMIRQVKLGEKVKTGPKSGYIKQHPVGGWHLVDASESWVPISSIPRQGRLRTTSCAQSALHHVEAPNCED
jgi:hypothetical protein